LVISSKSDELYLKVNQRLRIADGLEGCKKEVLTALTADFVPLELITDRIFEDFNNLRYSVCQLISICFSYLYFIFILLFSLFGE
jgi:hypothetical protein